MTRFARRAPGDLGRAPKVDGPRPCAPSELPEVIALVDSAMRQGTDQTMLLDYPLVYADENLRNVRLLRVGGELASVVPVLPRTVVVEGATFRVGIISPTATAPRHRHRGYASRCLASCIEAMREHGCALSVLWTLEETFPFYERAGYRAVRYQALAYRLGPQDAETFPADGSEIVDLDPADDASIDAVRDMHERDLSGVRRSPAEYRALFSLPRMQTHLALQNGRPVAYLVKSEAVNKPGLIEAGGDEAAISGLLRHALGAPAARETDAHANLTDSALKRVLDRHAPVPSTPVPAGMMIRVNDLRDTIAAFTMTLSRSARTRRTPISIGVADEEGMIRLDSDGRVVRLSPSETALPAHVSMTRGEWAAALFGAHPARPFDPPPTAGEWLGPALPLYFPIPVLDRS